MLRQLKINGTIIELYFPINIYDNTCSIEILNMSLFYNLDTPKYRHSTWNKGDTCIAPYPIEILQDGKCRWKL